jgi:gas vesicle protein
MFEHEEGGGRSFAVGLLLGALVGAGLALLFAPQSGEETRRLIRRRTKRLARDAGDKLDDVKDNVKRLKRRAEEVIGG